MTETKTKTGRGGARPAIVIDRAYLERLESLAYSASRRAPALAEQLLDELDRARIVGSGKMPANVVTLGNSVTYRDETTGREQTVMLVMPGEADIALGRVSVLTPIGVALLGLAEGASFSWETRQGQTRRLSVTRVAPAVAEDDSEGPCDGTAPTRLPDRDPPD